MKNKFRVRVFHRLAVMLAVLSLPSVGWCEDYRDGMVALTHGNIKEAVRIWTKLADDGNPLAQQGLGQIYATGATNVKVDHKKAFFWLSKCEDSLASCQLLLADLYDEGRGTKKDAERAAELYRRVLASKVDWPDGKNRARVQLGILHLTSELEPRNREEALRLFRLTAEDGMALAQYWLAETLSNKEKLAPEELVEIDKWFILASMSEDTVPQIMGKVRRKNIEKKMTFDEIETAERRALAWRPKR